MLKDFDILKETGGESFSALSKTYKAQVSENYIEIHLFWAGKGTCCVPGPGIYGPTISAISATPGNPQTKGATEVVSKPFKKYVILNSTLLHVVQTFFPLLATNLLPLPQKRTLRLV